MQRLCDAGAAHTQHERQKLVRQRELITTKPVMARQQPARQSLLDTVAAVRQSRVRELDQTGMNVAKKHTANRSPFIQRLAQVTSPDAKCTSFHLHESLVGGAVEAQNHSLSDQPFRPDMRD